MLNSKLKRRQLKNSYLFQAKKPLSCQKYIVGLL